MGQKENRPINFFYIPTDAEKYKTRLCVTYALIGSCKYEAKCQFAHGLDDVRCPKFKTVMCRQYACGSCRRPSYECVYAHGVNDARFPPEPQSPDQRHRLPIFALLAGHSAPQ